MSESFRYQLRRVRLMASGDPTWDLSPNDLEALKAVLSHYDELMANAMEEVGRATRHALEDIRKSEIRKGKRK